jgi:uncharacterized membrane protein
MSYSDKGKAMSTIPQKTFQQNSSQIAESLKVRVDAKRSFFDRLADRMTAGFGSMAFLNFNLVWFVAWIVVNLHLIPFIPPFDPFPFGLLTMIVSLEAIILAIVVLISQNRAAKIADLREEVDLRVDVITEQEITKILQLLVLYLQKEQVEFPRDHELEAMLRPTDTDKLEKALEGDVL